MKIYRIENKDGQGPFFRKFYGLEAASRHWAPCDWTNRKEAEVALSKPNFVFGFDNEETLFEVFTYDFDILAKKGYYLSVYEAEPLVNGPEHQIIFSMENAILVEQMKI